MKIECIRDKLQEAVAKAEKVSARNAALPVLQCVLFVVKKTTLSIKSTNLDLGVDITIPVKVEREGIAAVPASVVNNFLSNIQHKNILLELVGENLKISAAGGTTLMRTLPYEEFPLIPTVPKEHSFELNASDVVRGLRDVAYSSSIMSIKPELSSVYIHLRDGALVFVATDSFRLAEKSIPFKYSGNFTGALVPVKNVPEIIRIIEGAQGPVSVAVSKNQIAFSDQSFYLVSRVVEGTFPDYEQIIPKSPSTEAVLLKQDAMNALRLATVFSDKSNQVTMRVSPKKKTFEVAARNNAVGESRQSVSASVSGDEIEISFNYKYLVDCFGSIPTESVIFSFSGPGKPLVIRGRNDKSFTYLVMPMNR